MPIKTKEFASLLVAAVAAIVVAAAMWLLEAVWWQTLCVACAVFVGMTLLTLFIIRKYVAYKLKPIYSIVLSRNVHTQEILDELKDKHVENISEELNRLGGYQRQGDRATQGNGVVPQAVSG